MIATCALALLATPTALPAPAAGPMAPAMTTPLLRQDSSEDDIPPIQEEGDFYVINFSESDAPDEGMKLEEFVKVCQEATSLNFTYSQDTANLLKQYTVRMFGPKRIPKADFYRFFQIMMIINDFATIEVGPEHLRVIVLQNIQAPGNRNTIKNDAKIVLPDELDDYLDQPATLITTVLTLTNVDVRQLATSMRGLLPDQQTSGMVNAGNSDSVVLTGFGSNVAHFARLLFHIDEQAGVDEEVMPVFDVVPLEFASAPDVADLITQLLDATRTLVEQQNRAVGRAEGQGAPGQVRSGTGEAEILVESRTNSLIIMALPDDMPRIKELVARLDIEVTEPERNYHIYPLENVSADELADVLESFLRDASRVATPGGTGGRAPSQQGGSSSSSDDEVVVVPDPGTNSLLIAASKTRYEEVIDLIRQLDRRQDQVLIETALIELTSTDVLNLGVELGGANIPGADEYGGFGVSNFGLSTYTIDESLEPSKVPSVLSGFTAGIIDGDDFALPVLLNALETRNDVNVLNVPSVLVNNNGQATVATLDEFPTTQVTQNSGVAGGTQTNFASFQESGITLTISPSISASRYLRLGIDLSVSAFVGSFDSTNNVPPPRITRTLTTTVNVPDGDTMVVGGIITDTKGKDEDQIPFLGDLPILKHLFQSTSDSTSRTTLYFFVTPHILHDPDFADLAEISYRKKLDAAEVIGYDRVRVFDPAFGLEDGAAGMEGFELPLYRSASDGELSPEEVGIDPVEAHERLEAEREAQESAPEPGEPLD